MKNRFLAVYILFFCSTSFTACTKEAGRGIYAQGGTVTGKVTDARGNPLAGVKITVEHTVWYNSYIMAETDSKGNYTITLPAEPAGSWTAKAQLKKSGYNKEYVFDLDGDATAFTKDQSTVRNFTWKLSGQRPGTDTYYGAHADVYPFGTDVPVEGIKIIFTPVETTLIDGSPAVSFERSVEDVAGIFMVKDVPVGKYSIKAIYPGRILLLDDRHDDGAAEINKPVVFGKNGHLAETEYNIEFWLSE